MQNSSSPAHNEAYDADILCNEGDASSAVSWAAIVAGTFVTVAFSLMLVAFGAGMGFAALSPWPGEGMSAVHFTYIAAIWLIVVQWVSSGLGGYLTGRLRTKWVGVHTHEVFFRDTAHGFLTWAVATVVSAIILLSAASSALSGSTHMMGMAGTTRSGDHSPEISSYYVDSLFRSNHPDTVVTQDTKAETARILAKGMADNSLSDADKKYLAQLISEHTGLALPDANKRVDDMTIQVRQLANEARKTAASISIYSFLSMLIGAFIACAAAALGGRQRDEPHPPYV